MMYLTAGLHRALSIRPHEIARIAPGATLDWAAYVNRIARGAAALRALGLRRDDRLVILSQNTPAFQEMFMIAPWADLILASLNTRWSIKEMIAALDDADSNTLIVDKHFAPLVPELKDAVPQLRHIIYADNGTIPQDMLDWEDMLRAADPLPDCRRSGDDIAYLFYTSGTTGASKGVMLAVENLLVGAFIVIGEFGYHETMNYLSATPLFHVGASNTCVIHAQLGSKLTILPRFDPLAVLESISRDKVTQTTLVPTMVRMVIDHPELLHHDISSLQRVVYGAAPMPPALIARTQQLLPNVVFQQGYGLTESGAMGTSLKPEEHKQPELLSTVGRPNPGIGIKIVDAEGNAVGPGVPGEVLIDSPALMKGYWRKPEETARTLRDGWLHTGDGGYLDERGYLTLVDRLKDMIVSGGENVFSLEVENAIYACVEVAECAVIGILDPLWGEVVTAVIYAGEDRSIDVEKMLESLRALLGTYKTPRRVIISEVPLPKTSTDKISKKKLREIYAKGA